MATGKVTVCGVPTADGGREVDPDEVRINHNAPRIKVGHDPVLLHRDDDLVVVWKPSGMLSVAAPRRDDDNLITLVSRIVGQALAVHRLDEGTSGVMLVARNEKTQLKIKDLFEKHEVERGYLAVVHHQMKLAEFSMNTTLIRNRGDGLRGSGPGGKAAATHFAPIETFPNDASLVAAKLETGRTHQVRIHLAERGHAVLGDPLYGNRSTKSRHTRLALHANILGFKHPSTGKNLRFEVPLADDLALLVRKLRRRDAPVRKQTTTGRPAKGPRKRRR